MEFPPEILVAILAGLGIILFSKIFRLFFRRSGGVDNYDTQEVVEDDSDVTDSKKTTVNSKPLHSRPAKVTHPWLLGALKGHCDPVLDMQFSSNGKYLATCSEGSDNSEDGVPTKHETFREAVLDNVLTTIVREDGHSTINGEEECGANDDSVDSSLQVQIRSSSEKGSKPQRRRRRRKQGICASSKLADFSDMDDFNLPWPSDTVHRLLDSYILLPHQLHLLGYPHACTVRPGRAYIYRPLLGHKAVSSFDKRLDAGAKEFIPRALVSSGSATSVHITPSSLLSRVDVATVNNYNEVSSGSSDGEAGSAGSNSTDGAVSSESGFADDDNVSSSGVDECGSDSGSLELSANNVLTPQCVRCGSLFSVTMDGIYIQRPPQKCYYHWGKLRHAEVGGETQRRHQCCNGRSNSRGCSMAACHVWNGLSDGLNGPLRGYVCTRPRRSALKQTVSSKSVADVYALDCEMCFTGCGLQLARVSVVDSSGRKVYDSLVKPERPVVDYNSRFSGITQRKLSSAKRTFRAVQSDLMGFISADSLLIGHGLENDLRALRMVHGRVIDTAVLFGHPRGLPYRHSLCHLTATCLKKTIQASNGHDSLQDACACMQLVLLRAREDFCPLSCVGREV